MSVPTIAVTLLAGEDGRGEKPTIVVGPSLGTSVTALWHRAAERLAERYRVIGWDLPGHGRSPRPEETFSMAELAAGVRDALAELGAGGEFGAHPVFYAGVSLGGLVGLRLLLDEPGLFSAAAIVCSAAKIGEPDAWRERAAAVRAQGTPSLLIGSAQRWFAEGFMAEQPEAASRLLHSLSDSDDEGYATCCDALADTDLRDRLGAIAIPVVAIAGEHDAVTPYDDARAIASGVRHGSAEWVAGAAHLAPVEAPERVAEILDRHFRSATERPDPLAAGMRVRREVLGDAHVDRAAKRAGGPLQQDFQDFITRYAWGSVWTRPGLPRVTRSAITLTALIARGHWEEFALHVRAARRNGMSDDEIAEVVLQSAIYCGVPAANHAFSVLRDLTDPPTTDTEQQ